MNLQSTDFELFGVPARFAQQGAELDRRWRELQREAHPDRFAAQGRSAQRVAMQWSVRINEAYQRLKHPVKRATYLCGLNGFGVEAERNTSMPASFLMQQMEWREALAEADTAAAVSAIEQQADDFFDRELARLEQEIDVDADFGAAIGSIRSLMFVDRFKSELQSRVEQLEQ
jgi:molecular chaperone HscB